MLLLYRVGDIVRSPLGSDSVFMTFRVSMLNAQIPKGVGYSITTKATSSFLYILPICICDKVNVQLCIV